MAAGTGAGPVFGTNTPNLSYPKAQSKATTLQILFSPTLIASGGQTRGVDTANNPQLTSSQTPALGDIAVPTAVSDFVKNNQFAILAVIALAILAYFFKGKL